MPTPNRAPKGFGLGLSYPDGRDYKLDDYFDEGPRTLPVGGHELTNFHRTMSTYVNTFLDAGFSLEGIKEPMATEEQVKAFPKVADNLRVPEFIVYLLRKPY